MVSDERISAMKSDLRTNRFFYSINLFEIFDGSLAKNSPQIERRDIGWKSNEQIIFVSRGENSLIQTRFHFSEIFHRFIVQRLVLIRFNVNLKTTMNFVRRNESRFFSRPEDVSTDFVSVLLENRNGKNRRPIDLKEKNFVSKRRIDRWEIRSTIFRNWSRDETSRKRVELISIVYFLSVRLVFLKNKWRTAQTFVSSIFLDFFFRGK